MAKKKKKAIGITKSGKLIHENSPRRQKQIAKELERLEKKRKKDGH